MNLRGPAARAALPLVAALALPLLAACAGAGAAPGPADAWAASRAPASEPATPAAGAPATPATPAATGAPAGPSPDPARTTAGVTPSTTPGEHPTRSGPLPGRPAPAPSRTSAPSTPRPGPGTASNPAATPPAGPDAERPAGRGPGTTLRIGSWSARVVRGDQDTVDACRDAVHWTGPAFGEENGHALRTIVIVGHDHCGFQRFATLPVGTEVTVETPHRTLTYTVYRRHLTPGRGVPAHGLFWGDLTLQSCVGPDTGFTYLMRT
ncbi:hypothetical protein ACFWRV_16850 [Streptomyces sp. NPDC058576]|uniref:hypothetical protein n=1 Tax=Streptomyces sp. NPDC058576 TaxID=3346547 RepID=UPI00364F9855